MTKWHGLRELVLAEITQRREEGCDVAGFPEHLDAAGTDETRLMDVYRELAKLEPSTDFKYDEPNDLESIRNERPTGPRMLAANRGEGEWQDKFYGAWLGRAAG